MTDATITWINQSVLHASTQRPFRINETALVGRQRLLGEVIRINDDEAVIQVYEDTTGLRPGDPVQAPARRCRCELGPSLLGNIFDGLLRPLASQGRFVEPGAGRRAASNATPSCPPSDRPAPGPGSHLRQRQPQGCAGATLHRAPRLRR